MTCSVVETDCEAPPAHAGLRPGIRTVCFACGDSVCKKCSVIRDWSKWKRKRICNSCDREEKRFQ